MRTSFDLCAWHDCVTPYYSLVAVLIRSLFRSLTETARARSWSRHIALILLLLLDSLLVSPNHPRS